MEPMAPPLPEAPHNGACSETVATLRSSHWPTAGLCLVFNISSAEGPILVSTPMRRELLEMASTRWVGSSRAQRASSGFPTARQSQGPPSPPRPAQHAPYHTQRHPHRASARRGDEGPGRYGGYGLVWITDAMPRCSERGPDQHRHRPAPGAGAGRRQTWENRQADRQPDTRTRPHPC